jgi:hypothetical protein
MVLFEIPMLNSSEILKRAVAAAKETLQSLLDLEPQATNPRTSFAGAGLNIIRSGYIRYLEKFAKRVGSVEPAFKKFCHLRMLLH